jgi:hypothetical protein
VIQLYALLQGGRGGSGAAMGGSAAGRRRFPAPRPQRYDKEKFLQANFRFLVSSECLVLKWRYFACAGDN